MDLHEELLDSLRAKGHTVGVPYIQFWPRPQSGHPFVLIDDVAMPIEAAQDLDHERATLAAIASALVRLQAEFSGKVD